VPLDLVVLIEPEIVTREIQTLDGLANFQGIEKFEVALDCEVILGEVKVDEGKPMMLKVVREISQRLVGQSRIGKDQLLQIGESLIVKSREEVRAQIVVRQI